MLVTMHDMGEIRKTEFLSQRRGCTAIKAETQPYVIGANLKLWQCCGSLYKVVMNCT